LNNNHELNESKKTRYHSYFALVGILVICCALFGLVLFWILYEPNFQKWGGVAYYFIPGDHLNNWKVFNWHPILNTLAFLLIGTQAIVAFKLLPFPYQWKKYFHAGLSCGAMGVAILAFYAVYRFKTVEGHGHFYTVHSWLGLGTFVCYILQLLVGLAALLTAVCPHKVRRWTTHYHRFLGFCFWILALGATVTGIFGREWIRQNQIPGEESGSQALLANSTTLTVLLLMWTVIYVLFYLNQHIPDSRSSTYEVPPLAFSEGRQKKNINTVQ